MNLKRSLALALAFLMVLTVVPAFGAGETLDRIKGANKWETAVEISKEGWDTAEVVVLASGEKFADALAGVPLAAANDAPILLTEAGSLPAATKAEIVRLGTNKVFLLGGTAAISEKVEQALVDLGLEVERVKGNDRAETAAEIAGLVAPDGVDTVVLAYAWDFPDALAAASYAAVKGYPILLTEKTSISEATKKAIEDVGAENVILVGGTAVISDKVKDALADFNVVRVNGSNREGTSVALAEYFKLPTTEFFIATGDGFADAIAGAALAAKRGTGILLVRKSLDAGLADFIAKNVTNAVIFGGTGAVSAAVAENIKAKLLTGIGGIVGWSGAEEVSIAGKTAKPDADDEGFFKITGVAPGEYKVYFKRTGHETEAVDAVVVKDRLTVVAGAAGDKIEDAAIQGVVIDKETGAPLAAAIGLKAWDKDAAKWVDGTGTTALGTGIFKLETGIDAGGKYQVTVSLVDADLEEVYRNKVFTVEFAKDEGAKDLGLIEMELVKPMTLSGVLKDAEGEVVADKEDIVSFKALGKTVYADTDEDGKFSFEDLTLPSGKYAISVDLNDGDHAVYTAEVSITEGANRTHNINLQYGYGLTVKLHSGTTDELKLVEEVDEEPVSLVNIEVAELETPLTFNSETEEWSGTLAPGTYSLVAFGDFVKTTKYTVKITNDDLFRQFQITPAGAIKVTVTHDALVEVLDKDNKVVDSAEVEEDEETVFGGLTVGAKYTLRVSAEGKKTKHYKDDVYEIELNDYVGPTESLELDDVDTQGKVSGFVRKADGYPAAGAIVTYYAAFDDVDNDVEKGDKYELDAVGADGSYATGDLYPGPYDVLIRCAAHENYVGSMTIKAGDNKTYVNYRLVAGGNATLELTITDVDKAYVTEDVFLEDAYGEDFTLETDGNKLVATDLPAGTYTVSRAEAGGNAALAEKIVIAKGATVKVTYKLVAPAAIHDVTLWIVDEDYADVEDATVIIGSAVVTDDGNGYYTTKLVNGTYTAEIYVDWYLLETVVFTVKDGDIVLPQVQITPMK